MLLSVKKKALSAHGVAVPNGACFVVCKDKAFFAVVDAVGTDKKAVETWQIRIFKVILPFQKRKYCLYEIKT